MQHDRTVFQQLATSQQTRWVFGVASLALLILLITGTWSAGSARAVDLRLNNIEGYIEESRKERDRNEAASRNLRERDELSRRDILDRLVTLETYQAAQGILLQDVRADTKAIRDAVAPLPKPRD